MIIQKETIKQKVSKDFEKVNFGANKDGFIRLVEIASKDMYKNPLRSVMTEFVQNALDSHMLAKQDKPVIIKMPTKLDAHYIVRDFGVGMSDEQVTSIYSQIGFSNKDESNDVIGAYGMGKLCFAAYGGVLHLTTYNAGIKTIWFCRLQNGEGEISKILSENTTEENGVEISIPVKDEDISKFQQQANGLYKYLGNRVKVERLGELWQIKPFTKFILANEDHTIYIPEDDDSHMLCKEPVLVMGGLPLPLSFESLDISHHEKFALERCTIVFTVNIGDVDIVSSRDSLRYTKKTKTKLMGLIEELKAIIKHYFDTEFQKASSVLDYCKVQSKLDSIRLFKNYGIRGCNVNHLKNIDEMLKKSSFALKYLFEDNIKTAIEHGISTSWCVGMQTLELKSKLRSTLYNSESSCYVSVSLLLRKSIFLKRADENIPKINIRIKHFMKQHNENKGVIFVYDGEEGLKQLAFVLGYKSPKDMQLKFCRDLEVPVEDKTKTSSSKRSGNIISEQGKAKVLKLNKSLTSNLNIDVSRHNGNSMANQIWTKSVATTNIHKSSDTLYYMEIANYLPKNSNFKTVLDLKKLCKYLKHKDLDIDIYGVKSNQVSSLSDNWVKIDDYVIANLEKELEQNPSLLDVYRIHKNWENVTSYKINILERILSMDFSKFKSVPKRLLRTQNIFNLKKYFACQKPVYEIWYIKEKISDKFDKKENQIDFKKECEFFEKLLPFASSYFNGNAKEKSAYFQAMLSYWKTKEGKEILSNLLSYSQYNK